MYIPTGMAFTELTVVHYFGFVGTSWNDMHVHVLASREYIQQGENLFLVCLTRLTNARFSWLLEGDPLKAANASVLQVLNSSEASLGNYTCVASAEDGLTVASASVIVRTFGKLTT